MNKIGIESSKGLYELRDCKFNALTTNILEWMAQEMGLVFPDKPVGTGVKRSGYRLYRRSLALRIEEAFKSAYCFYIKGERHFWVINGKVWYYSLNQLSLFGSCQSWNGSKRGQQFKIPEELIKRETVWIIMAEDETEDVEPLYLLETLTTDRHYCELLKMEAASYPICEGKTLTVVEALPVHLQQVKPCLDLDSEDALKKEGYTLVAFEPDERLFLVQDISQPGKPYGVYTEALEFVGAWQLLLGDAIAATQSPAWDLWVKYLPR